MNAVICRLPHAGLGNQLFPLMKALVLSKLNGYPCLITGYRQFKPWHYLRPQKARRSYTGFFNFEKNLAGQYIDAAKAAWLLATHDKKEEAPLRIYDKGREEKIYN